MSLEYRNSLIDSREGLYRYAISLASIPEDLSGLRASISACIYPIKALSELRCGNFNVSNEGLSSWDGFKDRMAMIVQKKSGECKDGSFDYVRLSQRTAPQFALIKTGKTLDGSMDYEAPDFESFTLHVGNLDPKEGETVVTRIFDDGELAAGVLENGPVTEWVHRFLSNYPVKGGKLDVNDVHVIVQTSDFERQVEELHRRGVDSRILYSDGGQILVTSQSTLDWMNQGSKSQNGNDHRKIYNSAFRPNIVLDGLPANVEDLIDSAVIKPGYVKESCLEEIEGVRMQFGKMCVRCAVPNIDQETAKHTDQPGKWLVKNRPRRPDVPKATFGVNAEFDVRGKKLVIDDGDTFIITGEKNSL